MRFATEYQENIRPLDSKLRNTSFRLGEPAPKQSAKMALSADKHDFNTEDLTAAIEKIGMADKLVEFSIGRVHELELEVRSLKAEIKNSHLRGSSLEQEADTQRQRAEKAEGLAASAKARAHELGEELVETQKKLQKLTSVIRSAFPALNEVSVVAA